MTAGSELAIPVFSPALHCISMPAIVFLRTSFGYRYLAPKSVFFAFSWAFALFTIYAWNEAEVWGEYRITCIFGVTAIGLYWLHLAIAVVRELRETGRHDRDSGTSHILRLMPPDQSWRTVANLHLWAEPGAVLLAAALLYFFLKERHLSAWLLFTGICFWCKEAVNFWISLRYWKRHKDMLDDAEDMGEVSQNTPHNRQEPPVATRREPEKIPRSR